jgi:branched-chain amino acid transport system permease protein
MALAKIKVNSLWVSLAAGVVLAVLGALMIGYLCLRRRGIYFSMLTLAFCQLLYFVAFQASSLTGGHSGLRGIPSFALHLGVAEAHLGHPLTFYYFTLVLVGLSLVLMRRLLRSPFGSVLRAIRENEARAAACGHHTQVLKLFAFMWSGVFAGLAGSLGALHLRIVPVDVLHWTTSAQVVMMTLLGGAASFFGPFAGAALFLLLQEQLSRRTEHWAIVIGAIFVLCVRYFPQGIFGSMGGSRVTPSPGAMAQSARWTEQGRDAPLGESSDPISVEPPVSRATIVE